MWQDGRSPINQGQEEVPEKTAFIDCICQFYDLIVSDVLEDDVLEFPAVLHARITHWIQRESSAIFHILEQLALDPHKRNVHKESPPADRTLMRENHRSLVDELTADWPQGGR